MPPLPPFAAMPLPALHAELSYWDRMVEASQKWGWLIACEIREWRERCAGEIERREKIGRAA